METFVFVIAAAIVLAGAGGVILSRNPVHAALSLVAALFGIAVLFVAQDAHLLAAVQVIVYTGAIVVLILFVLMLLGVDKEEDVGVEPLRGQRPAAVLVGVLGLAAISAILLVPVISAEPTPPVVDVATGQVAPAEDPSFENTVLTGQRSATAAIDPDGGSSNISQIGNALFTDYVFAFEVTALLLTIAVVGAVVLARRVRDPQPLPADPEPIGAGSSSDGGDES